MLHNCKYFASLEIFNHCLIRRHVLFARHEANTVAGVTSYIVTIFSWRFERWSWCQEVICSSSRRHERKLELEISRPPALFCITCGRIFQPILSTTQQHYHASRIRKEWVKVDTHGEVRAHEHVIHVFHVLTMWARDKRCTVPRG